MSKQKLDRVNDAIADIERANPSRETLLEMLKLAMRSHAAGFKTRRYYVTTWDIEKQDFTPQKGVRTGPYTQFGLRKALRKLRQMGYGGNKSDNSTLVEAR